MAEVSTLFNILLALYLFECFTWVPRGRRSLTPQGQGPEGPRLAWRGLWPGQPLALLGPEAGIAPAGSQLLACQEQLKHWQTSTRALRLGGRLLAGLGAALIAAYFSALLPPLAWLILVPLWLLLHVFCVISFALAHKSLYGPQGRSAEVLTMALSPWASCRGADRLSERLFEGLDPWAATAALLQAQRLPAAMAGLLRRAAYPKAGEQPLVYDTWKDFVERLGLDPEALMAPPVLVEETAKVYCPRCNTPFVSLASKCPDCGIELRVY